jgi:hypothetical protein
VITIGAGCPGLKLPNKKIKNVMPTAIIAIAVPTIHLIRTVKLFCILASNLAKRASMAVIRDPAIIAIQATCAPKCNAVARLLHREKCQQDTVAQPKHCVHTWDSLDLLRQRGGIREPGLRFLMPTVFH